MSVAVPHYALPVELEVTAPARCKRPTCTRYAWPNRDYCCGPCENQQCPLCLQPGPVHSFVCNQVDATDNLLEAHADART